MEPFPMSLFRSFFPSHVMMQDENKVCLEYMQMHTLFLYDSSES